MAGKSRDASGLTDRQRKWLREYKRCENETEAAIRAGYSPRSARKSGYLNRRNAYIAKEIEAWKNRQDERIEQKTGVTKEWVISRIMEIVEDPNTGTKDKLKGLELIGKSVGAFEPESNDDKTIRVVFGAAEDWAV